jgi:hypothetical protein
MNDLLSLTWLKKIVEPHTRAKVNGRPRILVVDGHGSHLTPAFLEYCEEHSIIVLCVPAHTSHILQPIDRTFPSLKHWFRREVDKHLRFGEMRVSKAQFMELLRRSRPKAFTEENVKSGFCKTGLKPFNPALALRQLPTLPPTPPRPLVPLEFQTPKTLSALNYSIQIANACDSDDREGQKRIRSKIDKAAATAMTKIEILEREAAEKQAFQAEQQVSRARKRRRALGGQALTVGEANAKKKELEEGGTQGRKAPTTRQTQSRKRPATPDSPEESLEDSSSDDSSGISSCIICEAHE